MKAPTPKIRNTQVSDTHALNCSAMIWETLVHQRLSKMELNFRCLQHGRCINCIK